MDLQELWQEHKRWILGIVAGLVVFWVASSIIEAVFDSGGAASRVARVATELRRSELYGRDELKDIEAAKSAIDSDEARVRDALSFEPGDRFVLAGKGDPEAYFPEVAQRVRTDVLGRARELSIEFADRDMTWAAPVGREEIERTLLGLCVLENAAIRLFDAGEAARREDPDALGLVSIDKLAIEKRASTRTGGLYRRRSKEEPSLAQRIEEVEVQFSFRSDVATLQHFLEQLRVRSPRIALGPDFKVKAGEQIGDPLVVSGTLTAFRIQDTDS